MLWRACIDLLVRTVIDSVAHSAVCALGYRTTYLQAHSSATLRSCPGIPQKNITKAEAEVSLQLASRAFTKQICVSVPEFSSGTVSLQVIIVEWE